MSPNEPDLPAQEEPDIAPSPEIEPSETPQEMPPIDPGDGNFGQPMA